MRQQSKPDILIITLDSCRWDTFIRADNSTFTERGDFEKAYAQGTYTYPSHLSIYSGILPDCRIDKNYYNRFKKTIFRIDNRKTAVSSLFTFPKNTKNIFSGFKSIGYQSIGIAAVEWFQHEDLQRPFEKFYYTGVDIERQVGIYLEEVVDSKTPTISVFNIGETHDPFEIEDRDETRLVCRDLMRLGNQKGYRKELHEKQIRAMSYVNDHMDRMFIEIERKNRSTIAIVCGDHGECFGEDNCYGHGFYHEKIMEVPLGIFALNMKLE